MLETYFAAALLERDGYRAATAVRYLRAAAHLGAEHWPTSIYRPSSGICEPAVVPARREEGVTTTPRSAPSATATTSCKWVFVDAA
jgi:hypothetical protein